MTSYQSSRRPMYIYWQAAAIPTTAISMVMVHFAVSHYPNPNPNRSPKNRETAK